VTTLYPFWIVRRAPWFLLAVHVPLLSMPLVLVVFGGEDRHPAWQVAVTVPAVMVLAALHLRHVFAAARDTRPDGWAVTLVAQAVIAFGAMWWIGADWVSASIPFGASAMAVLPGRGGRIGAFVGTMVLSMITYWAKFMVRVEPKDMLVEVFYLVTILPLFTLALYGTVRYVRLVNDLHDTRTELAQSAVNRERVRVSRDLHDLLGQSLSAISLKGDLAIRLLPVDPARARSEITGLTEVARTALNDVYAITRDDHSVTLTEEVAAAAALLAAAGVDTTVTGTSATDPVLAWAVREGTTNLLRHSDATRCTITLTDGSMEMANDGVRGSARADGSGIAGLRARAEAVGGTASAEMTGDEFVLRVRVGER
jgi:two-component system sensor histidine kinase DesK